MGYHTDFINENYLLFDFNCQLKPDIVFDSTLKQITSSHNNYLNFPLHENNGIENLILNDEKSQNFTIVIPLSENNELNEDIRYVRENCNIKKGKSIKYHINSFYLIFINIIIIII